MGIGGPSVGRHRWAFHQAMQSLRSAALMCLQPQSGLPLASQPCGQADKAGQVARSPGGWVLLESHIPLLNRRQIHEFLESGNTTDSMCEEVVQVLALPFQKTVPQTGGEIALGRSPPDLVG